MQLELRQREAMRGPAADGLLLGLWIGEVFASAEYWILRGAHGALRVTRAIFLRPALLASIVGACAVTALALDVSGMFTSAREMTAGIEAKTLATRAELYRRDNGSWPARLEDVETRGTHDVDPWGHSYALYRGEGGIAVVSAGADGLLGTPDDIVVVRK